MWLDRDQIKQDLDKLAKKNKLTANERELVKDAATAIRQAEADLRRGGFAQQDRSTD